MMFLAVLPAIAVVAVSVVAIEKKRQQGPLTYPLWRGNLLLLWGAFMLVLAVLTGLFTLPRFVGLALHGAPVEAIVTQSDSTVHCHVIYRYTVQKVAYTGSDSRCGLKAGMAYTAYYNGLVPENSTLYLPEAALKNEFLAMALIVFGLATFLILWLRVTYIIGGKL